MAVKKNVFASKSERENFYKLSQTWGIKYRIYHNLPFLNVLDTQNLVDISSWPNPLSIIMLNDLEIARLKKTSIDYTLCDGQDSPILCIEFDGLQEGFNVGAKYYPHGSHGEPNPWRQEITELKLKVAHGSLFPYFVVGSKYFDYISPEIKLTIVDGIIGEVLSSKAVRTKLAQGFDPEELGYSEQEFNVLPRYEKHELVQDWVIGVEVDADFEHNPISQKAAKIRRTIGVSSWGSKFLHYPDADRAKTLEERAKLIESAVLEERRVTLHTTDCGDITADAWLPNFKVVGYSGYELCENIATILAVEKLKRKRASRV